MELSKVSQAPCKECGNNEHVASVTVGAFQMILCRECWQKAVFGLMNMLKFRMGGPYTLRRKGNAKDEAQAVDAGADS